MALDGESIYPEFSYGFQLLIKVETCWIRNIDIVIECLNPELLGSLEYLYNSYWFV